MAAKVGAPRDCFDADSHLPWFDNRRRLWLMKRERPLQIPFIYFLKQQLE